MYYDNERFFFVCKGQMEQSWSIHYDTLYNKKYSFLINWVNSKCGKMVWLSETQTVRVQ